MTEASFDTIFSLTDEIPAQGKRSGFVKIPIASDQSSFGFLPVPLATVGGGKGPTVLLLAGVVGGEYAAQVAAAQILHTLDPDGMNGRVIVMTMANYPAAEAGTRISPIDRKSLNKSFPGDVFGTPTSVIAEYIERQLMPISDFVIDLHSEGRTMSYLSSATFIDDSDRTVQMRRLALARAFGVETILRFRSFDSRSTSGAARRTGATRIGAEISGPDSVAQILQGIERVLAWAGIVGSADPAPDQKILTAHRHQDFLYALDDGLFQPVARLGQSVRAGDLAGRILDVTRPLSTPRDVRFPVDGIVVGTRDISQVYRGDCVMLIAEEADEATMSLLAEADDLKWVNLPKQRGTKTQRREGVAKRKFPQP